MTIPAFGRRLAWGLLAAPALGSGAAAQGRPVAARAPPCAGGAGEVVGLVLTGSGAPAGTVVVFGQAFRPGDVPQGSGLAAKQVNGAALPLQLDVTTRHPDGSVRFAVLALAAPALRRGQTEGVILSRAPAAAAPEAETWDGLGALVLELAAPGGAPWRVDLRDLARATAARGARPWQSGALARQLRVEAPVPAGAVGGATSMRLVADLALRRDGSVWGDVWLRNDIAMAPGGGTATYAARLEHDGRRVLSVDGITQHQYTALGRAVHRLRGDAAPVPPQVHPDVAYLAETGAVARYDVANGVDEALLARMGTALAAPSWDTPFNERGLTRYMPSTGGRFDIGPATGWQAAWLISGDPRAAAVAIGQAEAAGGIPWHFWDPQGGAGGTGGWLDTRRWPGLWSDPRGGRPPRTLAQPIPTDTGWSPDQAHLPATAFVPYLLTGRRAFLDELQAQGARAVIASYPGNRNPVPSLGDVIIVNGGQVRGSAWGLRDLDGAAWLSPDADGSTAALRAAATANWAWLRSQLRSWSEQQGEAAGWIPGAYRDAGAMPPWQQDYFASTVLAATMRGNGDARAVLEWMRNFLAGRFLNDARGMAPPDGIAYRLAVMPETPRAPPYASWSEIGAEMRRRGWSSAGGWARTNANYGQLAIASLAGLVDALHDETSRAALNLVLAARPNGTSAGDYRQVPTFAIVVRGTTRATGQVGACVPVRGARG